MRKKVEKYVAVLFIAFVVLVVLIDFLYFVAKEKIRAFWSSV